MVYDWKQGRMCQSFQGHNREVTKVTSIVCVQTDKGVKLVQSCHTFLIYVFSRLLILPPSFCQVVCYPGSTWIFSASRDKTVLMWDLNQGDEPIQEFCGHELVVNGVAISPGTYSKHTHTHTLSLFTHLLYQNTVCSALSLCRLHVIYPKA